MHGWINDTRYALRRMRRHGGLILIATGTLAIGIGTIIALMSIARPVILAPLPFPDGNALVAVKQNNPMLGGINSFSTGNYLALVRSTHSLSSVGAYTPIDRTLTGQGAPRVLHGARVTPSFIGVLGVQPVSGSTFSLTDSIPGDPRGMIVGDNPTVLLSYATWTQVFGRGDVVGSSIALDGKPYRVVGVMPAGFAIPDHADFWVPMVFGAIAPVDWGTFSLGVVGRLAAGSSQAAAQTELNTIATHLHDRGGRINHDLTFPLTSLKESLLGDYGVAVIALLCVSIAMLVLICANLGTMLLAQGIERTGELAVRSALGSPRWQVMRPLMLESMSLAIVGAFAGCALAPVIIAGLVAVAPSGILTVWNIHTDITAVGIGVGAAIISGLLFGVGPAFHLARMAENPRTLMHGRAVVGNRVQRRFQGPLVALQLAIAVVLVTGTFGLGKVYHQLVTRPIGVDPQGVVTADLTLPGDRYSTPQAVTTFAATAARQFSHTGEVSDVAVALRLPVLDSGGGVWAHVGSSRPKENDGSPEVTFNVITADYFRVLNVPIQRGQAFQADAGNEPSVVVSESFARSFFGTSDPIGQYVTLTPWPTTPRRVIGVAGDVLQGGMRGATQPAVYVTYDQVKNFPLPTMHLLVKGRNNKAVSLSLVQQQLLQIDPLLAFGVIAPLTARVQALSRDNLVTLWLVGMFGLLGLALASAGTYAVTSLNIAQQTREIGIRGALGASPRQLWHLLLARVSRRAFIGIGCGVIATFVLYVTTPRWIPLGGRDLLYVLAPTTIVLIGTSFAAIAIPLWRATQAEPAEALRRSDG